VAISLLFVLKNFQQIAQFKKSRDSSVGVALGSGLDDRGSGV
jgi:hypothetical protein